MGEAPQPGPQDDSIDLTVVHGHLAFARFPVLVGHYSGDTFAGAEARLDRALDYRLSQRRKMGLYPGPIGTSVILLDPKSKPPGAVVVGVGEPAGLSTGALRETLRRGMLAFAAEVMDRCERSAATKAALGLSVLPVGTGEGDVDRTSSMQALLQATAQANAILARLGGPCDRLAAIEIVELYENRAFETWRAAKRTIDGDPALKAAFALAPKVSGRDAGRGHEPIARDPNWWLPIQITMPRGAEPDGSLAFTVGGGFARAEARTIAANLDIVAPLLRRTAQNIDLDGSPTSPGRILFELLWPESLKHRSAEEQNRRLILDERSAAFPWELMDDRRPWVAEDVSGTALEPPAVRSGLIRQLLQTQASERASAPRGAPKALVIGDPGAEPPPGFPRLPGAEAEARAVAKLLEPTHDPKLLVTRAATPEQIFKQLYGQAWEIVHISAHGVVDHQFSEGDGIKRTGVVLGPGVVIGPAELSQLPVSSSIVFVNCCNLGKIDAAAEDKARQEGLEGRPELAASVAVQLIRLGVRCVVAAGWEVSDDGGKTFATTFYEEMLAGATFGEATQRARKATYVAEPNNNTWGAFQCYGDPDYRLRPPKPEPPSGDDEDQFVGVSESIAAAEQVYSDVNVGLERNLLDQGNRLDAIEKEARRKGWLASDQLCVALAEARAELGDLQAAIELYAHAMNSDKARFKVSAVEQFASLSARRAVGDFRKARSDKRSPTDAKASAEAAKASVEDALRKLKGLTESIRRTPERLSLQAGCWKRLAQLQSWDLAAADEALGRMKQCCLEAVGLGGEDPDYPRFGICVAEICLSARNGTPLDAAVGADLQRMIDQALGDDADFWDLIRSADARTILAIVQPEPPLDLEPIKDGYRRAWRHIGSPVKMRSVTEQLEFYEDILSGGAECTAEARARAVAWIAQLRAFIESEFLSYGTTHRPRSE